MRDCWARASKYCSASARREVRRSSTVTMSSSARAISPGCLASSARAAGSPAASRRVRSTREGSRLAPLTRLLGLGRPALAAAGALAAAPNLHLGTGGEARLSVGDDLLAGLEPRGDHGVTALGARDHHAPVLDGGVGLHHEDVRSLRTCLHSL